MTTWTQQTKNSSSYSDLTKNSSSYSNTPKVSSSDYLLMEDNSYLLQEDGYKFILEQSTISYIPTYTLVTKN